ncbi:Hypothetical Protein FCC1311_048532 [Hondaea fermentalgiana]|uniref:Uncharacterized protein n=1 Tax=Hondaea fermentalgiana TaxID=2315210 RepID=A0A2R5GCC4_9STRA|nr:Hypothetical Protein FCC1311_048532 [Hondaea fermentalgiana]|eukprot:GBG28632.1 Hypothetical Protein FCC1311_048532 [Hondaea fermentalgiana]
MAAPRAAAMPAAPADGNLVGVGENMAGLEMILGRLPDAIRHDHLYQQSRAYSDLTELLLTRAPRVVSEQIRGLLVDGYRSVLLNEILPIRLMRPGDSARIEWSTIHFDPALAPQVEVEGVAPIYTHSKTKHSARVVRRATGIKMESGFYQTAEGRREWAQKIAHLAAIVQNTNEIEAMFTLLEAPYRQRIHADELNGPYNVYGMYGTAPSFMDRLRMDVSYFGIVNKTPSSRGFQNLVTSVRTAMGRNGVRPDYFLVPPMMMGFYYGDKDDLWHYSSAGPQALKNREDATDIGGKGPIRAQQVQGLKVVDLNLYRMTNTPASTDAVDIMTVPRQIGEFYAAEVQAIYRNLSDFDGFSGTDRDIRVFNEEHGVMATIRFSDMIRNCLRWDGNGNLNARWHSGINTEQDAAGDPFVRWQEFPQGAVPIEFWCEMHERHLRQGTLERISRTLVRAVGPSIAAALAPAVAFVRDHGAGIGQNDSFYDEHGNFISNARDPDGFQAARDRLLRKHCAALSSAATVLLNGALGLGFAGDAPYGAWARVLNDLGTPDSDLDRLFEFVLRAEMTARGVFDHLDDPDIANVDCHPSGAAEGIRALEPLERFLTFLWMCTRTNRDSMLRQHDKDIFVPVNFMLCRPYMTYNVSSAVVVKGGTETGETVIGGVDFQCTSNNMDRTIYGSLVYYGKSIVRDERNVAVTPSVFIQSYIKGNDTTFITEEDTTEMRDGAGLRDSRNSIVCLAVSVEEMPSRHTVLDIRGNHEHLQNVVDGSNNDAYFYGSAPFYRRLFDIEGTQLENPALPFVDYRGREYNCNSICWRGHYEFGKGFKDVSTNTGHLGMNVYDGVHLSRTPGNYVPVRQVAYAHHTLL